MWLAELLLIVAQLLMDCLRHTQVPMWQVDLLFLALQQLEGINGCILEFMDCFQAVFGCNFPATATAILMHTNPELLQFQLTMEEMQQGSDARHAQVSELIHVSYTVPG